MKAAGKNEPGPDREAEERACEREVEAALGAAWNGPPVWIHGDVSAANLLVAGGRLGAVIDSGSSGVGDPACDLTIAWTFFFGENRDAFRARLPLDDATWALWKALITLASASLDEAGLRFGWRQNARKVIDELLVGPGRGA